MSQTTAPHDYDVKQVQAAQRCIAALGKPMLNRLRCVASAGDQGFKPHSVASGAKLGAWTRLLKRLALWGLVYSYGWQWHLTQEGSRVCAVAGVELCPGARKRLELVRAAALGLDLGSVTPASDEPEQSPTKAQAPASSPAMGPSQPRIVVGQVVELVNQPRIYGRSLDGTLARVESVPNWRAPPLPWFDSVSVEVYRIHRRTGKPLALQTCSMRLDRLRPVSEFTADQISLLEKVEPLRDAQRARRQRMKEDRATWEARLLELAPPEMQPAPAQAREQTTAAVFGQQPLQAELSAGAAGPRPGAAPAGARRAARRRGRPSTMHGTLAYY